MWARVRQSATAAGRYSRALQRRIFLEGISAGGGYRRRSVRFGAVRRSERADARACSVPRQAAGCWKSDAALDSSSKAPSDMGWQVAGVEVSDAAAQFANERLGLGRSDPIRRDPAFPAAAFDVVVMFDTIEHLFDPRIALSEISRVLAPGGLLLVATPNFDALSRWLLGPSWAVLSPLEHMYYFQEHTLRRLLETCGFDRVQFIRRAFRVDAAANHELHLHALSPRCAGQIGGAHQSRRWISPCARGPAHRATGYSSLPESPTPSPFSLDASKFPEPPDLAVCAAIPDGSRKLPWSRAAAFSTLGTYRHEIPMSTAAGMHPLIHYVLWGAFEGRRPCAPSIPRTT